MAEAFRVSTNDNTAATPQTCTGANAGKVVTEPYTPHPKLRKYDNRVRQHISVDILPKWGKHKESGTVNLGGKPYNIIYIMAHHESGCAWLVLKHSYDTEMWEYEVPYELEIPTKENDSHGSVSAKT